MKKIRKILICTLILIVAIAVAGCGGSDDESVSSSKSSGNGSSSSKDVKKLEITENGWMQDDDSVYFAVTVKNPNKDLASDFANLKITAKDEDGKILFTDEDYTPCIFPGQDLTIAGMAGYTDEQINTMEFKMKSDSYTWKKAAPIKGELLEVSNVNSTYDEYDGTKITGEVTMTKDMDNLDTIYIYAIGRDADGKIVFGLYDYFDADIDKGESEAFEITGYDLPEFEKLQVVAAPTFE